MKSLREIFENKDKKVIANIATAFTLGIVFLICGSAFFGKENPVTDIIAKDEVVATATEIKPSNNLSYDRLLEARLSEVLSQVEGAGKVEVMLTLSNGREIIVAEDIETNERKTKETDSQGGIREQFETNNQGKKIVISGKNGYQEPLVLKEIEPKVEGVIIVSQGGDDVFIKDALIKAAQTVLGVEPHKVQVLKMK